VDRNLGYGATFTLPASERSLSTWLGFSRLLTAHRPPLETSARGRKPRRRRLGPGRRWSESGITGIPEVVSLPSVWLMGWEPFFSNMDADPPGERDVAVLKLISI
jgi:hypothetical protein